MRNLVARLTPEQLNEYETIKSAVLEEHKLSPAEYRKQFENAKKGRCETWGQFSARLRTLFTFYEKSREVQTREQLEDLVISDKFRECVPGEMKNYLILQEGAQWFKPDKLGELADIFASLPSTGKQEGAVIERQGEKYQIPHMRQGAPETRADTKDKGGSSGRRACYRCGSSFHLARRCPTARRGNYNHPPGDRPQGEGNADRAKVHLVEEKATEGNGYNRSLVAKVSLPFGTDRSSCVIKTGRKVNTPVLHGLQEVTIDCAGKRIPAIVDSGTQITVVSAEYVDGGQLENSGAIKLQGAFGQEVVASLIKLPVSGISGDDQVLAPAEILVAVTDKLAYPCLLPPGVYEYLLEQETKPVLPLVGANHPFDVGKQECCDLEEEAIEGDTDPGCMSVQACGGGTDSEKGGEEFSPREKLIEEQNSCSSLQRAFQNAKVNKNGYFLREKLLFHRDKITGESVNQLVLPRSRIKKVLELAHESVFGGHLGHRKTSERIRYSFFWPDMKRDVRQYVNTCEGCQMRAKRLSIDRVPITPVARPELPFQRVNVDVIGPIEPASGRGHRYILCLVCQHSRWPEAVPLRSLTARATCDALLQIFARTGIPDVIATDRGTNFVAGLTTEFMKRLGASPRLSTPGHPASNGLVERWNGVLKGMIHHTIREDPKNWDRQLPFLLWAYREVPNCTTGVAPFKLLYGREPTGPLSVLQKSWAGEIPLPCGLADPAEKYLQELKERMEVAAEQAALTATEKQQNYAKYFNRRTRSKDFKVGDQVILLIPDSTNKLYSRWTGPGEVMKFIPPYSYKVKLPDDSVKHVHANKMRKYKPRAQAVGVIFESEEDFGEVQYSPSTRNHNSRPLTDIFPEGKLNNLTLRQRKELRDLLKSHENLFSGKLKRAITDEHVIKLKPGAERAKPYIYRIPEALKAKVDQQIEELLEMGLIEPSQEEIAHPIVCVSKKDGDVRLCIDFRSLNSVTACDPFPMENASDLLNHVGKARYITVLDCLKGYWSIPLEEKSRPLTSFVTHRGQYRWKVMAFGLKNAAATFQKAMNQALSQFREFARAYIDDVAIFSETWEEHLRHLDLVLSKLEEVGLAINLAKCSFAQATVRYLGHVVGSGTHAPDPEKIAVIQGIKRPVTKKELRSFLGLCNYYREYIMNYAELAFPLTELTKRRVPMEIPWGETAQRAFEQLKQKLCELPTLYTPELGKPFIIYSDASDLAVGVCLAQRGDDGKIHPISFASHKFTEAQKAWAAVEREAFAVVWALKKFETWVFGVPVQIVTDHNPLTFLTKCAPQSSKLQRWAFALQKFDLTISHCPGADLKNADGLSRLVTSAWERGE